MKKYSDIQYPIWHPYTNPFINSTPIKITHGKGVYIYDDKKNKYIDAVSSWWVNIHGHANPKIAKAIYKQATTLEQVLFANFTHQPALKLATNVLRLLGKDFKKVFFSDNGSTAVEVAIKMAIQFWKNKNQPKTKILALKNSYHGDTFGAMSIGSRSIFSQPFESLLFDVDFVDLDVNELKNKNLSQYAFFIYEPIIQGVAGMKIQDPKKLFNFLLELRKNNVLLIADEVMTAWGRTNKIFASQYLKIQVDIICLSKGLTGGFLPLGLSVCNKKIFDAFLDKQATHTFYHGHSYTANPIACAAANASIEILTQKTTQKNMQMITDENKKFVTELTKIKHALNPRCCGTILAFEINNQQNTYNQNTSVLITKYFFKKKIFLRPLGNTIYIMPPLCITKKELKYIHDEIILFLKHKLIIDNFK